MQRWQLMRLSKISLHKHFPDNKLPDLGCWIYSAELISCMASQNLLMKQLTLQSHSPSGIMEYPYLGSCKTTAAQICGHSPASASSRS